MTSTFSLYSFKNVMFLVHFHKKVIISHVSIDSETIYYYGCFIERGQEFKQSVISYNWNKMTVEKCMAVCFQNGFTYAGLPFGFV